MCNLSFIWHISNAICSFSGTVLYIRRIPILFLSFTWHISGGAGKICHLFGIFQVQFVFIWFIPGAIRLYLVYSRCNSSLSGIFQVQFVFIWYIPGAIRLYLVYSRCNLSFNWYKYISNAIWHLLYRVDIFQVQFPFASTVARTALWCCI